MPDTCHIAVHVGREVRLALAMIRHHERSWMVALATVVGVLVEVPVMLSVVAIVNGTRHWYEAGGA